MKGIKALIWAYEYDFVDNSMVSQNLINYCLKNDLLAPSPLNPERSYWITKKGLIALKYKNKPIPQWLKEVSLK